MACVNIEAPVVYVVLDVETTGLTEEDRIVQIACLKIDKYGAKSKWIRYINPCLPRERQLKAYQIHNISPEFLLTKPTFKEVAKSFLEFLGDVEIIVAHNALFDWSMLSRELRLMKDEDLNPGDNFLEKFQWLDLLRLTILHFPGRSSYTMETLKKELAVNPEKIACELSGGNNTDDWKQKPHDAMYDSIVSYKVLVLCMGEMSLCELVQNSPQAILDTRLFSDMQHLLEAKKTRCEDLLPFAHRAKDYFTTFRPKGKTLGTLSKDILLRMTGYHENDPSTDRRIVLIYKAAYLDPPCLTHQVNTVSPPVNKGSPKIEHHINTNEINNIDKDLVTDSPKQLLVQNRNVREEKYENQSQTVSKQDSIKDKGSGNRSDNTLQDEKHDWHLTPPKKMKII